MRILVAGALGEVGRSVAAALLDRGHDVTAVSTRAPLPSAPEALTLEQAVALVHARDVELVLNAAGRGDRRPDDRSGLAASEVLAPACAEAGVPGVLLSTSRVLEGHDADFAEDAPPQPRTPYAEANALNEAQWLEQGGPQASVLRITNFFCQPSTPDSPQSLLLPWSLVTEALRTGRIGVRSGPSTAREFVSADDVARAVLALAGSRPQTRVCASAPGLPTTLDDLVRAVQGAFEGIGRQAPPATFGPDSAPGSVCQPGWLAECGWSGSLTLADIREAVAEWVLRWTGSEQPSNPVPEVPQS